MKAYRNLPEGYKETLRIDIQKDKKAALKVNIGGGIAMLAVLVAGHFIVPIARFFDMSHLSDYFLRLAVLIFGYLLYAILHEFTHAVVMKAVGGGTVEFGFTGMYAFAGSHEDYFDKMSYRCIALAPLIVWGIVFTILSAIVPQTWFWIVWFLQAGNIGGAAGDVYVTGLLWNKSETILVKDTGVEMTVYDRV